MTMSDDIETHRLCRGCNQIRTIKRFRRWRGKRMGRCTFCLSGRPHEVEKAATGKTTPSSLAWNAANPEKRKAHKAIWHEVRLGRMSAQPCEVCGAEKSEAHHTDYSKPLDVIWLCRTHHRAAHKRERDAQKATLSAGE